MKLKKKCKTKTCNNAKIYSWFVPKSIGKVAMYLLWALTFLDRTPQGSQESLEGSQYKPYWTTNFP